MDPRTPFQRAIEYQHLVREMQGPRSRRAATRVFKQRIGELLSSSRALLGPPAQEDQQASAEEEALSPRGLIGIHQHTEAPLAGDESPKLGGNGKKDASREEAQLAGDESPMLCGNGRGDASREEAGSAPLGTHTQGAEGNGQQRWANAVTELENVAEATLLPRRPAQQSRPREGDKSANAGTRDADPCLSAEEGGADGVIAVRQVRCPIRMPRSEGEGAPLLVAHRCKLHKLNRLENVIHTPAQGLGYPSDL